MDVLEFVHVNNEPEGVLAKFGIVIVSPGQTAIFEIEFTDGVGYMVTVKLVDVPLHPFNVGVTVIVLVMSRLVVLGGAVHDVILPVPFATRPIAVFEFVHVKELPVGVLVNAGIFMVVPGHTEIFEMEFAEGVG